MQYVFTNLNFGIFQKKELGKAIAELYDSMYRSWKFLVKARVATSHFSGSHFEAAYKHYEV
jgi:hypothetical protein